MNQQEERPLSVALKLEQLLLRRRDEEEPRKYIQMSKIGGCQRQHFYAITDPVPFDADTLRMFEEGRHHERIIVADMIAAGIPVTDTQLELTWSGPGPFEFRILGHIDGIFWSNAGAHLLEVKSLGWNALKKYEKEPGGIRDAWPHYYAQLQAYLHGLQDCPMLPPNMQALKKDGVVMDEMKTVTTALMVLKDRNMGAIAEEWIDYDPHYCDGLEDEVLDMISALDNDHPPRRFLNPAKDWQCQAKYCGYRERCLKQGEGR